jgi:hypothetical protein
LIKNNDEGTIVVELSRKNMQKGQDRTTEHQREHVDKPANSTCRQNMEKKHVTSMQRKPA